ncbi:Hsp20/alpha crystallin family protein [Zoogloea sp.]|uniref:Hsp20/alpha crystallin family protein n=1 Tax=Zoogloea sp. TaxID=49181 RepID=UPI001415700A|nr:MAG: Hsp20/alpha crystallin family protein [Zoogloea sp.]
MSNVNAVRSQAPAETPARPAEALLPPVDVVEDAAGITLFADLPGVSREKLGVHIEGDTLTIEGEISLSSPEGLESTHTEVGLAVYRRVFTLSKELDPERIAAEFNQGVLKLRIPKVEHAQPRRIEIRVA